MSSFPADVERLPDQPCPECGTVGPAPIMYRDPPCCDWTATMRWLHAALDDVAIHGGDVEAFKAELRRRLREDDET